MEKLTVTLDRRQWTLIALSLRVAERHALDVGDEIVCAEIRAERKAIEEQVVDKELSG